VSDSNFSVSSTRDTSSSSGDSPARSDSQSADPADVRQQALLFRSLMDAPVTVRQLAELAAQLEQQTQELTELNTLKNKLFSIIAHDLKAPLYALRTLFRNVQLYDLPGEEIKILIPEVVNELTYTTGLMENLLQWAKTQMQAESVKPQMLDISRVTREVIQLLRLQADAKHIYMDSRIEQPVFVYADRDMVNLVLPAHRQLPRPRPEPVDVAHLVDDGLLDLTVVPRITVLNALPLLARHRRVRLRRGSTSSS